MTLEAKSAWTQYWKEGHTESLPKDRAAGRLVGFDAAWRQFFIGFSPGARLLDLATGGGDVIRRALAAGRNFEITGVDLADIAPVRATFKSPRVRLIGDTELAPLPFADATFDGVTSQFGIEYGDVPAAAREAIRVLSPGGRGRFVLHHADSAITRSSASNLAAENSLFADAEAIRSGRTVFGLYQSAAPAPEIARAEEAFRESVRTLLVHIGDQPTLAPARGIALALNRLATEPRAVAADESLRRLDRMEDEIRSRALRKQAQIDSALDRNAIDRLAAILGNAGATVTSTQELNYPGGSLLGWALAFRK